MAEIAALKETIVRQQTIIDLQAAHRKAKNARSANESRLEVENKRLKAENAHLVANQQRLVDGARLNNVIKNIMDEKDRYVAENTRLKSEIERLDAFLRTSA